MDKFDRGLDRIRKLIDTAERNFAKSQKDHAESKKKFKVYKIESRRDFDRRVKEIKEIQRRTDLKLDRLIDSWGKKRTNGNPA
jgi:hypothetical protein